MQLTTVKRPFRRAHQISGAGLESEIERTANQQDQSQVSVCSGLVSVIMTCLYLATSEETIGLSALLFMILAIFLGVYSLNSSRRIIAITGIVLALLSPTVYLLGMYWIVDALSTAA